MRQPHQVLIFPYKKQENGKFLYGIFLRTNGQWQAISGGVEDDETYLETCRRELFEETGVKGDLNIIELDSTTTIPVVNVTGEFTWGEDLYHVEEHSFGVDFSGYDITLSHEHQDMKWLLYEEARKILTFDSNKNALWELNYKLEHNKIKIKK